VVTSRPTCNPVRLRPVPCATPPTPRQSLLAWFPSLAFQHFIVRVVTSRSIQRRYPEAPAFANPSNTLASTERSTMPACNVQVKTDIAGSAPLEWPAPTSDTSKRRRDRTVRCHVGSRSQRQGRRAGCPPKAVRAGGRFHFSFEHCPSPKPSRDAADASRTDAATNVIGLRRRETHTHGCSARTRRRTSTSTQRALRFSGCASFVAMM
jgi:hypothetical protein